MHVLGCGAATSDVSTFNISRALACYCNYTDEHAFYNLCHYSNCDEDVTMTVYKKARFL
jgi:hypothetical protein